MILIDDATFAEIRAVIHDVTDTFHQKVITYIIKGNSLDINNEDRDDEDLTRYDVNGLVVWAKTDTDAKVMKMAGGNLDLGEGYVNFNYDDCDIAGLISNLRFIGDAEKDLIEFDGVKYRILAIVPIGQFPLKNSLVRIIFEKILQNGS